MSSYKQRSKESILKRAQTLRDADEFAKKTFIQLRKDDTCIKRFLRFFRLIPQQKLGIKDEKS